MIISEGWLREWVDPDVTTDELVEQLTMAGLEVDGTEPVAGEFEGVVVGEVVKAEQHPNADRLRLCQVDTGEGVLLPIVCGAPNARTGIKVACAQVGAVLPGNFRIKKAKLRGVESEGMLCSASELKLSEESDGILELPESAPVGTDIREFLQLNDRQIDIDLTPNRGDCLSVLGIAREVGVINRAEVQNVMANAMAPEIDDQLEVRLSVPEACPKFLGRVIRGINPNQTSPLWLQEKLRRCGVRSIHPVVDVTQYILLELGQPMHAYDLSKLEGAIEVRFAKAGEKLVLLDGQEVELKPDTLIIADDKKPLAMAGIMGGKDSGVTDPTVDIYLECAFFSQLAIAGRARGYGLHTDASHRYERGVDYELQRTAIEKATELLMNIVGGKPGPVVAAFEEDHLPKRPTITLRPERIKRLVGIEMGHDEVEDVLTRLGMRVESVAAGWQVEVPSYRFDMNIEVDLIEELVRIHGYNKLPTATPTVAMGSLGSQESVIKPDQFKRCLVAAGFQEMITYSFVDPEFQTQIFPEEKSYPLLNPISQELSVMRVSLWPGLLKSALHNINRQQNRIRCFEQGLTFTFPDGELQQATHLAGLIYGNKHPLHWSMEQSKIDFFDAKGHVESLLALTNNVDAFEFVAEAHVALHPGQSAAIKKDGVLVGWVGALHPSLAKKLGFDQPVYLFDLVMAPIEHAIIPKYQDFSKFPANKRDIAVLVDEKVTAAELQACARKAGGEFLKEVEIFDVYRGDGLEKDTKSIALSLTIRNPSRTLKDSEISQIIDKVVVSLKESFQATLRE